MWSDSGEWCKVDLLVLTDLCFVPHRHQKKKQQFSTILISPLQHVHHPNTKKLACVQAPPLPSAKIDFSQRERGGGGGGGGGLCMGYKKQEAQHFLKSLTPIILCPLLKCLSGTTFIYNYSHNFARITTDNSKPPTCKFHIFCNDMDFCQHWWNACR